MKDGEIDYGYSKLRVTGCEKYHPPRVRYQEIDEMYGGVPPAEKMDDKDIQRHDELEEPNSDIPHEDDSEEDEEDEYFKKYEIIWKNGYREAIVLLNNVREYVESNDPYENISLFIEKEFFISSDYTLAMSDGGKSETPYPTIELDKKINFIRSIIHTLKEWGYNVSSVIIENPIGEPFDFNIADTDNGTVTLACEVTGDDYIDNTFDKLLEKFLSVKINVDEILKMGLASDEYDKFRDELPYASDYEILSTLRIAIGNIIENFGSNGIDLKNALERRAKMFSKIHEQISNIKEETGVKMYLFINPFIVFNTKNNLPYYGITNDILEKWYDSVILREPLEIEGEYIFVGDEKMDNIIKVHLTDNIIGIILRNSLYKEVFINAHQSQKN